MRRRDVLAGVGSLAVIGGAGTVAIRGLPSFGPAGEKPVAEPHTVETIDAPGSEAGEVRVPETDRATFVDFFGTWCEPCSKQMPELVEAHERLGDDVLFMSVTNEDVGGSVTEDEVVDWWADHNGNWTLGIDPVAELSAEYSIGGVPYAVAIDADGRIQWSEGGRKSADELVDGIERALEASDTESQGIDL